MADVLLKDITGDDTPYEGVETVSLRSTGGGTETFVSERLIQNQVQADWTETDTTSPAYILNKPEELPEVDSSHNGKLLGVLEGKWAIVNVPEGGDTEKELPEIDPNEDEGRLLGVSGGEWTKVYAEKELPEIESEDDEGKVLTVDANGAAVWETPARGLPDVAAAENGAFLRVIDGKWAAVALTDVSIEGA